jgi:hypothetical protein
LLFEPADLGSLADRVMALYADPALRAELGRRGADGVRRHHGARQMAERTAEAFASLLPRSAA